MKDYASYLPAGTESRVWQAALTASGFTRIRPGSAYPPGRHPLDHLFTWQRGRVLQVYQVVYILRGRGTFESSETKVEEVTAGTVFVLFPGVWHRYQPDQRTGWVESWIELQGAAVERLERGGVVSAKRPVLKVGRHGPLEALFDQCHRLVTGQQGRYPGVLCALGLQILAWLEARTAGDGPSEASVDEAVRETQRVLATNVDRQIKLEDFAERLNVSYSAMRHAFKARVGVSPKQYHLQMRLRKAKELLQNTGLTVEEISRVLGFGSAFHLSNVFKQHVGKSPTMWRRGNRR